MSGLVGVLKGAAGFVGKRIGRSSAQHLPPEDALRPLESHAVDIVRHAGSILRTHFEGSLDVAYKDEKRSDPVTNADYECQKYLRQAISARFPEHGILGEEDDKAEREASDSSLAPDYVWVLDPLDGTRNFLSGMPMYASSVGVLHKGAPVAAAVFLPWNSGSGGLVLHARKGGGTHADGVPLPTLTADEPLARRLITLPGSFASMFRVRPPLQDKMGELRMTGSIAYELALVAKGVTQYAITTAPFLWDAAGGALLVMEAGGVVLCGRRKRLLWLWDTVHWEPLEAFVKWGLLGVTMGDLRKWRAPLILGSPAVAQFVAANLTARQTLLRRLKRRLLRRR